jgi:hypothetical protein
LKALISTRLVTFDLLKQWVESRVGTHWCSLYLKAENTSFYLRISERVRMQIGV